MLLLPIINLITIFLIGFLVGYFYAKDKYFHKGVDYAYKSIITALKEYKK